MPTNEYIDLGCGLDSPAASPLTQSSPPKKIYPNFSFSCDEPIDLPEGDFTFMAKGRKVLETGDKHDPKNPRHRYEIEVQGFKPMGAVKKSADMPSMSDAFRKGLNKSMMSKMSAEDKADGGADDAMEGV